MMKLKSAALLLTLILVCLALACAEGGGRYYQHSKQPFKLRIISGWEVTDQGAGLIVSRERGEGEHSRDVTVYAGQPISEENQSRLIVMTRANVRARSLLELEEALELKRGSKQYTGRLGDIIGQDSGAIDGETCNIYDFDGQQLKRVYILFHNRMPYMIQEVTRKDEHDEVYDELHSMLTSLRWTD